VIVVDASAAVAGLLNDGPARTQLATETLCVPHLIDSEIASALRRKVLAAELTADDGWAALDAWRRLGVSRYPTFGVLDRIWELRNNVSAYDATYVALAEVLGCALATADGKLASAPDVRCPIISLPR